MKTRKSRLFLGIIAITMALGLLLLAAPPTHALNYTLAELLAGQNVTIGDKLFSGWGSFSSIATGGAAAIDPATITVFFSMISPFLYEVDYQSANFFVGAGQTQDTRWTYSIGVVGGAPLLEDNGLNMISFGLGHNFEANLGRISISETVLNSATGAGLGTKLVFDDHGNIVNPDHISWNPPVAQITVSKDVALSGDNGTGGGAFISDFSQTYSQVVPEPISLILLGSGLAGAGLYRRLRRPKG